MKHLLTLLLFISTSVMAEIWECAFEQNNQEKRIQKFERIDSSSFLAGSFAVHKIIFEDNDYIHLAYSRRDLLQVNMLSKKHKMGQGATIMLGMKHKDNLNWSGSCSVN